MCVWRDRFDGRYLEVFFLRGLRLGRVIGTVTGIAAVTLQMIIYWLSM